MKISSELPQRYSHIGGITAFFDGSITKNPGGTASYGMIVKKDKKEIHRETWIIGTGENMSCNVAEYCGLFAILDYLLFHGLQKKEITIFGDSQIVINTMSSRYKEYSGGLCKEVSIRCKRIASFFPNIKYFWIPREQNQECDAISK